MTRRPNCNARAAVGIDPGVNGGIGWLIPTGPDARIVGCTPLVSFDSTRRLLRDLMRTCPEWVELVGFVEQLQPKMGRSRGSYGSWKLSASMTESICACAVELGAGPYMVKPDVWQRRLGLYDTTKIERRETARKWYPAGGYDKLEDLHGLCKVADQVCEGLLISEYGWRTLGNMP